MFQSFLSFFLLYVEHDISPGVHACLNLNRSSREVKDVFLDIGIIVLYQVLVGLEHFFMWKVEEDTTTRVWL